MKEQANSTALFVLAVFLILIAVATRLLPHPDNFTAIGAMALFSGFVFRKQKWAYMVPLIAMVLTDLILGLHFSLLPVYACLAITVALGFRIQASNNWKQIGFLAIFSSILFFLITNLPFWYLDLQLYPMTFAGTMSSYEMALPFFKNQLAGDLLYSFGIFGVYHILSKKESLAKA